MELKNIVLHHIKREGNNAPVVNMSSHLLDRTDSIVQEFVEELIKSFSSKRPTYGTFQEDSITYPFQSLVKEYRDDSDFLNFSIKSMNLLEKDIQVPQAKGGYVIFTHYWQRGADFLITIMLDKSDQFTIDDENLDIKKLKALDINKLARANRINFKRWDDGDDLYLSFIKGTRDVSSYFQKFIGNTDLTSSKVNSKNLKNAILKYMRENDYNDEKKEKINSSINTYLNQKYISQEDVELTAISAYMNPDSPDSFSNFVQDDEGLVVSGKYRINRPSDFNMFHRAKISGKGYKVEFENNLIKLRKVIREGNDLIFKDLPEDILNDTFDSYGS